MKLREGSLTALNLTDDVGVHDPVAEAAQAPAEQHLPQRRAQGGQDDARQEGEG